MIGKNRKIAKEGKYSMRKRTMWITGLVLLLTGGVAGTYAAIGTHYQTHFFEGVTINGIDVSDLTVSDAERLIGQQAEDYRITVITKENTKEVIEGADIGYQFVSQGEVQSFLEEQNFLMWLPAYIGDGTSYTMEASVTYEEDLLAEAAANLSCMQEDQMTAPADAYVALQSDGTYGVVPEVEGSQLNAEKVNQLLKEAVDGGAEAVNLAEADCYEKPAVYQDDASLKAEAAIMNRYSSMVITCQMGGGVTEILDWSSVGEWFSLDENRAPVIDREAVAAWVNALADTYDTIGTWPEFVTSNGETVWPQARTYGWQMDRESETEALYQILLAGDSTEHSPVWYESARTRGQNDIGDTYIEIDYTNQRMWYYKDGVLLVETPVVTGNVSAGNASPEGIFCILYKEEDATLVGEDYKTPVEYWMPFYGGVGIHDADSWRSAYGGDIYQWGGSHGCINTPTAQAKIIFENVEAGTPVVCYSSGINYGYSQVGSSEGTTSGSTAAGSGDIVIIDGGGSAEIIDETILWEDDSTWTEDSTGSGYEVDNDAIDSVIIGEEWMDE